MDRRWFPEAELPQGMAVALMLTCVLLAAGGSALGWILARQAPERQWVTACLGFGAGLALHIAALALGTPAVRSLA